MIGKLTDEQRSRLATITEYWRCAHVIESVNIQFLFDTIRDLDTTESDAWWRGFDAKEIAVITAHKEFKRESRALQFDEADIVRAGR